MKALIYLDYMATTPIDPRVLAKMSACLASSEYFGNASSQNHRLGWQALELIDQACCQVADCIHADPKEIIWTSGATEADNLAIKGAANFYQRKGKHLITMKTEHSAVLNACAYMETLGFEVTYLNPNSDGLLNIEEFKAAIRPDTILASIMWVNNETGVIQNIEQIAQLTRANGIVLHVDAAQAIGRIPVDLNSLPVDLMSFSAHKVYGPKGIGALYVRRNPRIRLTPQIHGGEQQYGLRSGTLPTHQIVGMGEAFAIAQQELVDDQRNASNLADLLWQKLKTIPEIYLNGHVNHRVPQCINLSFKGLDAETLMLSLADLALSSGSACHSAHMTPSHVLTAMGIRNELSRSAVRISFGRFTQKEYIIQAGFQLVAQVQKLRQLSPVRV